MIEAFTPHAAQKAFTDGICSRGVIRCCEHLDATRVRNPSEAHSKLTIPQSRFCAAISLINATVSSGIFGLEDAALDVYFQNNRNP